MRKFNVINYVLSTLEGSIFLSWSQIEWREDVLKCSMMLINGLNKLTYEYLPAYFNSNNQCRLLTTSSNFKK